MIKGNSMTLYRIVVSDGTVFFLSAFTQYQAECFAANFTSLPLSSITSQDNA